MSDVLIETDIDTLIETELDIQLDKESEKRIILFNDEHNTFDFVIQCLMECV